MGRFHLIPALPRAVALCLLCSLPPVGQALDSPAVRPSPARNPALQYAEQATRGLEAGNLEAARSALRQAAGQLTQGEGAGGLAHNLGVLAGQLGEPALAAHLFRLATEWAEGDSARIEASINRARALSEAGREAEARALLPALMAEMEKQPESEESGFVWLALIELQLPLGTPAEQLLPLLSRVRRIAETRNLPRLLLLSLDGEGALHRRDGNFTAAMGVDHHALLVAQSGHFPQIEFRIRRRVARSLRDLGHRDQAIEIYRQTVELLALIRSRLLLAAVAGQRPFRTGVGAVYYELADLLLQRADARHRQGDPEGEQLDLLAARDAIEQLKAAEIENYFRDDCVLSSETERVSLGHSLPAGTAILYPILFTERLELLVGVGDRLYRKSVPLSARRLRQQTTALRTALEQYRGYAFRSRATRLYDHLIRPVAALLEAHAIHTLVFAPDDLLRTLPIAVLFDGEHFLVERYAVATTPGLGLTRGLGLARGEPRVLMSGLSEAVKGHAALPAVIDELESVAQIFKGQQLLNDQFTASALTAALKSTPYSLVHIATHGVIEADVRRSYLLTWDGKLTMDELEQTLGMSRFREQEIELLTLSACQTAVGDERAALGLGGIALKAGARSALATLWSISDRATSKLITQFYQRLKTGEMNKAQALRQAQLHLLQQTQYRHPGFWGPFLLIGSWL